MLTLLAVVHIFIALLLIGVVLLQDSKGGAMGILGGGGGSNSLFGSTGAVHILVKVTRWLAVIFAATCIGLAYYASQQHGSSVLDTQLPAAVPNTETIDTSKALEQDKAEKPAAPAQEKKDEPKPAQ